MKFLEKKLHANLQKEIRKGLPRMRVPNKKTEYKKLAILSQ